MLLSLEKLSLCQDILWRAVLSPDMQYMLTLLCAGWEK